MRKLGPRMSRILSGVAIALAVFASVHPLAKLLARWDWRADLLCHFQGPAMIASLAAAIALARTNRYFAVGFLLLAGYQAVPLWKYAGANPVMPKAASPRLRILSANVYEDNDHYQALADLIGRERPDVVGFLEYSHEWASGMSGLSREFAYRYEAPGGARGLALWFRTKPQEVYPTGHTTEDGFPFLHARILFDGEERHVWLVHPSSPLYRRGRHRGFPELDGLARRIAKFPGSCLVVGDMNTTDASPYFDDFLRATGLRDSRLGFGRQPSWPAWSPYRIAIDHAFVSGDLAVTRRKLLPPNGSDHLALFVEVAPAAAIAASTDSSPAASPSP